MSAGWAPARPFPRRWLRRSPGSHVGYSNGAHGLAGMSHPVNISDVDLAPVEMGKVWENPVSREGARLLEARWHNVEGRLVAELTALVGARVPGEHRHPALVELFTVLEGR